MISEHELYTVYDLFFLNNGKFGFYMVNALPRSYVQVMDYGRSSSWGWVSCPPLPPTDQKARFRGLAFLVDRYTFGTHELIAKGLLVYDTTRGWARYQPDL